MTAGAESGADETPSAVAIGPVTAASLLIECPEVGTPEVGTLGRKQIASLTVLAPLTRQSGQWRGHAFIQGGRKFLRDALNRPALAATRVNPDLKAKYQALRDASKPAKVALMRKRIELANTLIKKDTLWQPKQA